VRFENTKPAVAFGEDVALFTGKWVGLGAASGIETASFEFSVVNRVEGGVMAESRFFFDLDEARGFAQSLT
jgi:hypothetical protein